MATDWDAIFDWAEPRAAATEEELAAFVSNVAAPLITNPLPESYLDLLRWTNGGCFACEERELTLFSTREIPEMLQITEIAEYMPGCFPIGSDGGGTLYLIDMREPPMDGEYPLLYSAPGCLDFESAGTSGCLAKASLG